MPAFRDPPCQPALSSGEQIWEEKSKTEKRHGVGTNGAAGIQTGPELEGWSCHRNAGKLFRLQTLFLRNSCCVSGLEIRCQTCFSAHFPDWLMDWFIVKSYCWKRSHDRGDHIRIPSQLLLPDVTSTDTQDRPPPQLSSRSPGCTLGWTEVQQMPEQMRS